MKEDSDAILADKRIKEYLARQRALSAKPVPAVPKPGARLRIITLSRECGAGGHTVANKLQELLGKEWSIWDRELLDKVAESAEVSSAMVEALDHHGRSWVEEMGAHLLAHKTLHFDDYRRHLVKVLLSLAQQGFKIIMGRGANYVLKSALNVRLEADKEFRIKHVMEFYHMSRAEAERHVAQEDRQRATLIRQLFDKDVADRTAYDMILRTDCLGFDVAAEVIATAARKLFPVA